MTNPALEVIAKIDLLVALIQSNREELAKFLGKVTPANTGGQTSPEYNLTDVKQVVATLDVARGRLMTATMSWNREVHNAATIFQVYAGKISGALGPAYVAPLLAMNPFADEIPPESSSSIGPSILFNPKLGSMPASDPILKAAPPEYLPEPVPGASRPAGTPRARS